MEGQRENEGTKKRDWGQEWGEDSNKEEEKNSIEEIRKVEGEEKAKSVNKMGNWRDENIKEGQKGEEGDRERECSESRK